MSMEEKKTPDQILKEIRREEKQESRGKLKIFFGYAAGVGKTYAMLDTARVDMKNGVDVVAGYIEPHERPDTMALVEGFEVLPPKILKYKGMELKELDLDAALQRKPELILVDELAHTNAEGCRHAKRYQDISELLEAGINVYTTVNVQHLESLNDIVASITHVMVRERIPDSVFDKADQVELVDIEPEQLIKRLEEGKVYRKGQAERAAKNFFQTENLTALREIALRRTAESVNKKVKEERACHTGADYYTGEHIVICISPSPTNMKVIRTAARMASAFRAELTALFVETTDYEQADEKVKQAVYDNIQLAKQFGARASIVYGDNIAYQIAEYAKLNGISKIVLGRTSLANRRYLFFRQSLIEKIIAYAPNLDLYVIPDGNRSGSKEKWEKRKKKWSWGSARREALKSRRMEILLNTSWKLRRAMSAEEILREGGCQAAELLGRSVIVYNTIEGAIKNGEMVFPKEMPVNRRKDDIIVMMTEDERAVADWVMKSKHKAGRTTDTLPSAAGYYLPVTGENDVIAVYGVALEDGEKINPFEKNILKAILNETAFAAEKYVILSRQRKES